MKILEQAFNWELEPLEINEPIYSELEQSDVEIYKLKEIEEESESEISEISEEEDIILYMINVSEEGQSSNNEYEEYNEQISSKEGICERRITFNEK